MISVKGFLFGTIFGAITACGTIYGVKKWCRREIRGYLDLINLTADQRHKVEKIREGFLPRVAGIRQELRRRRMHLADLLFSTPLDHEEIRAAVEEISGLQLKLEQEVIEHIIEENEILTLEQQSRFHGVIIEQFRGGGLGIHDVPGRR
ncbi:MAG: periplasmic heavy metal sensor [Desulfovibrionales bacterium]|nr:periplasmic heavy metal sensor [Desulfovibrionales bacterium]